MPVDYIIHGSTIHAAVSASPAFPSAWLSSSRSGPTSCRMQVVLRHSANKAAISTAVEEKIVEFANRGYRALGLSRAQGLEGMPPRSHDWSVPASLKSGLKCHAVRHCRRAELRVHVPAAAV